MAQRLSLQEVLHASALRIVSVVRTGRLVARAIVRFNNSERTSADRWFMHGRANEPHKLTKAAGLLARRRSRLGRLQLRARGTSAALRSSHCVFVAAAAAPPGEAGTEGG